MGVGMDALWLDPRSSADALRSLCVPFASERMEALPFASERHLPSSGRCGDCAIRGHCGPGSTAAHTAGSSIASAGTWCGRRPRRDEDAAAIDQAFDALDARQREVLVLHFLEDLSLAEVAAIVGCPEGTVKSRIYHAKKALKDALV